jgi:hypothetical protein
LINVKPMLKRLSSFCLLSLLLLFAAGYTFAQKKDTTRIREVEAVDIFKKIPVLFSASEVNI